MRLRTIVLVLFASLPLFGQTFPGATVKTVDASRGMREAVVAARTQWIAWTVPSSARVSICCNWNNRGVRTGRCSGCTLDGRNMSIDNGNDGIDVKEPTTTLLIAIHLEDNRIARVRMFDADCPISANGMSVTMLQNVTTKASVDYITQQLHNSDADELMAVLAMHEDPQVVPTLINLARNDQSTKVRRGAIFWLGQKAGVKAAAELRYAVDNDPQDEVREHAVFAISQLPREKSVPMLIDLVKTHKSRRVRERAMFWLAESGDPRALDLIEKLLTK